MSEKIRFKKSLLHLDASARSFDEDRGCHNSISRQLAHKFRQHWQQMCPDGEVIYRDLGANPPMFVSELWIAAVFTPETQRTAEQRALLSPSDIMIDEVLAADTITLSTPMYNYGMPAALKAWFDQVIRVDKTFTFNLNRGDFPLEPVFSGKTMVLLASCGEFGFQPGGVREHMNHLGPHVEVASRYLGVERFHEIRTEYQEFGDSRHAESLASAYADIEILVQELTA